MPPNSSGPIWLSNKLSPMKKYTDNTAGLIIKNKVDKIKEIRMNLTWTENYFNFPK